MTEARVNQTNELLKFKWGVARLIMESETPPLVLPFYHHGLADIMPLGTMVPRIGGKLSVRFGNVIDFANDKINNHGLDEIQNRIRITRFLQGHIQGLKDTNKI